MPRNHTAPAPIDSIGNAGAKPIPAVGYLRCSSDAQELSVEQQRGAIEPYAVSRGYNIIRWYIDEGKSASKDTDKRIEFLRMVEDSTAKDFRVVLCYDASRFTRLDGIDGSEFKRKLRDNGVFLDTTKEGEFDWTKPEGRWKDQAFCEANKAMSLNISKDSIRGRRDVLRLGFWPLGVVPYGYDKIYTDGTHEIRVTRSDKFRKGRGWHLKLVINEAEATIVREIFDRVVRQGISLRALSLDLSSRGIPSPEAQGGKTQGLWDKDTIKGILHQRAYTGVAAIGYGRHGRTAHNRVEPAELEGACPVIIDRATFVEAGDLLDRKRADGRKPQYLRSAALSGFLVCGHCGYRLKKNIYKKTGRIYFTCESASKHPARGCKQWRVYEDQILPDVVSWLVQEIDAELLKAHDAPKKMSTKASEADLLRSKVKDLESRAEQGTTSALLAPVSARQGAWDQVETWQRELAETRERLSFLEAISSDPGLRSFGAWWVETRKTLVKLPKGSGLATISLAYGTPSSEKMTVGSEYIDLHSLRGLLTRLGLTAKLWWRHDPEARLTSRTASEWILDRQEIAVRIALKNPPEVEGDSNRHSRARSRDTG